MAVANARVARLHALRSTRGGGANIVGGVIKDGGREVLIEYVQEPVRLGGDYTLWVTAVGGGEEEGEAAAAGAAGPATAGRAGAFCRVRRWCGRWCGGGLRSGNGGG